MSERPAQARRGAAVGPLPERVIGVMCGIAVIALFSGFTLISRLGFHSRLALPDLAALRFGIGGMLLLPVFLRYGLSGLTWPHALALAFLGGFGFALFAYTGFLLAPAAHGAVLLHGTLPLFTFAIALAVSAARFTRAKSLGVALIAVGIAFMAWDSFAGATSRQLLGDAALLMASMCWSGYGLFVRRLGLAPVRAAAIVAVFSMIMFLPIYVILPGKALFAVGWNELLLQAIFQGVLIGAVSIFIYTRAVSALGAAETALFTAAVPCVTTLAAIPLLGEVPSAAALVGVAVVTLGMITAMRR